MDETQHTTSTIKADEDKSNLAHFQHILGPKIAHFCLKSCIVSISDMDETWHTSSTFKADDDKNSSGHF